MLQAFVNIGALDQGTHTAIALVVPFVGFGGWIRVLGWRKRLTAGPIVQHLAPEAWSIGSGWDWYPTGYTLGDPRMA